MSLPDASKKRPAQGTNWFGRHASRPTEHVLVENCKAESLDGAVVIGSEMSGGVNNVTISGLDIHKAGFAFWIKSERGRGGVVRDVTFDKATLHTTAGVVAGRRVISLDMYCEYSTGLSPHFHLTRTVAANRPPRPAARQQVLHADLPRTHRHLRLYRA